MPKCFVVMGFGKKTDFSQNKTFDLDKSYRNIIKPAVEAAGFTCVRADEIQHAGNINVPMYEQLYDADLVIADLSTANLNAFFELGVRYALKPRTTIVISEKGFKIPFDMGQVIVRSYEHLGDGIDFDEVQRMRQELTAACTAVAAANRVDSPVYTFLTRLTPPELRALVDAATPAPHSRGGAAAPASPIADQGPPAETIAAMMTRAMAARDAQDFRTARAILVAVKELQGEHVDPYVVQRLALVTYQSKDLDPRAALLEARALLEEIAATSSSDPESLGIWGAVHKRLAAIGLTPEERRAALEDALRAYERGFYLQGDAYNGVNYAFLLDARAAQSSGEDAVADRVQARRVRERVLRVVEDQLATGIRAESRRSRAEQEFWIHATMAEALLGLGRVAESQAAIATAMRISPPPEKWMIDSMERQIADLAKLLS